MRHRKIATAVILLASIVVLLSRLCHLPLVWVEEAYGMAAAQQLLYGRELYSGIWFDKPPVYAWFYLLSHGLAGWHLRLLDVVFTITLAWAVAELATVIWKSRWPERPLAFALTCFMLTFWIPSAVMAIAPDQLVLLPFVLGMWAALDTRPKLAGAMASVAVLCNSKGLIVLPIVLLWTWREYAAVLLGFMAVQAVSLAIVHPYYYWQEVWRWGLAYSADTFVVSPFLEGIRRTGSWLGFHLGIAIPAILALLRARSTQLWSWLLLSGVAVIGGFRFFPRYYFLLLPVLVVCAARGFAMVTGRYRVALAGLLLVPLLRFGPRYFTLATAGDAGWSDTALMEDSRSVAAVLHTAGATSSDTLLVWGYRPDVYVFSGLRAGTPFLDSQPLTGVLADRHLSESRATFPQLAAANRRTLTNIRPTFIVDGLGRLNPALAITRYKDLSLWISEYNLTGSTKYSDIYRLR